MGTLFETEAMDRVHRSAEISECGRYRWWLRRSWTLAWDPRVAAHEQPHGKGTCCFVMLNPSTADAMKDDPTIRRCIGFARHWGYTTLSVRNLCAWRATDPRELGKAQNVTGGHRGDVELLAACTADLLVAAWGAGAPFGRDMDVLELWAKHFPGKAIYCLGTTKNGHPKHPLYVKADTQPIRFAMSTAG